VKLLRSAKEALASGTSAGGGATEFHSNSTAGGGAACAAGGAANASSLSMKLSNVGTSSEAAPPAPEASS
jgi:hypothetical protein